MRYLFPRRVPTDRQLDRVERALDEGRYHYMRKSSENGYPLVFAAGVVLEEVSLGGSDLQPADTQLFFHRMPTRAETRRYEGR